MTNKKNIVLFVKDWEIVKETRTGKGDISTYCKILNNKVYLPVESHFLAFAKNFPRVPVEEIREIWNDLPFQDVEIQFIKAD